MPLQVFRSSEVFVTLATLEHCLDQVVDTAALQMSLQVLGPGEVFEARATLEHCLSLGFDTTAE